MTEEHRNKIRLALTGRKRSPQECANISRGKKGKKQKPRTIQHRLALSSSLMGHKLSEDTKRKISQSHIGKKLSIETRRKMSEHRKAKRHLCSFWKGGITPINQEIRGSMEYKLWRSKVFKRDGYLCVIGGKEHGNKLQADHIKPFASYPELRLVVSNGRTLCVDCHRKTDTYALHLRRT